MMQSSKYIVLYVSVILILAHSFFPHDHHQGELELSYLQTPAGPDFLLSLKGAITRNLGEDHLEHLLHNTKNTEIRKNPVSRVNDIPNYFVLEKGIVEEIRFLYFSDSPPLFNNTALDLSLRAPPLI